MDTKMTAVRLNALVKAEVLDREDKECRFTKLIVDISAA
jgi:hypothetical protein